MSCPHGPSIFSYGRPCTLCPPRPSREACSRCGHIVPSNKLAFGVCRDRQACDHFRRKTGRAPIEGSNGGEGK